MLESPTFQIPRDVIEPIIQAQVVKGLMDALGSREEVVTRAVSFMLNVNVDDAGKPTSYRGQPWIAWCVMECVQKAVKQTIVEYLVKHQEVVKKEFLKQMTKPNSPIVKKLLESIVSDIGDENHLNWHLTVKCE